MPPGSRSLLALICGVSVSMAWGVAPAGARDENARPEVPSLVPAWEPSALERYEVTLVPRVFVRAEHPFRAAGGAASSQGVAAAQTVERATLFTGTAPGRTRYVVRDAEDRRWVVYEISVLDPVSTPVLRRVPELPPGVRAVLGTDGRLALEGTVVGQDDYGALRVLAAATQAVNRVEVREPLPEPE